MARTDRTLLRVQTAVLVSALAAAVLVSAPEDWRPPELFWLLVVMGGLSQAYPLRLRSHHISGSFLSIVLAMVLLGPLPAVTIALVCVLVDMLRRGYHLQRLVGNLACYATFPLVGALVHDMSASGMGIAPATLGESALLLAVFLAANFLNFLFVAVDIAVLEGVPVRKQLRDVYVGVLPVELATGLLTAGVAFTYQRLGLEAVALLALVLIVFQYLLRTAFQAIERGEEVEERNQQLAALQVGLISTMLKTLSLRDRMTARHSAAVARYSREMAVALGLPEEEVELIHTAALFHDIGKFIFPDDILLADTRLTDEQFAIVKRHPEVGAELIGEIDGYGPVAEVVRSHHERIDGRGYPDGLMGEEIPLGSRIISVADVYDVITARDTYRQPVTSAEAFAELRRSAGSQLDADLVEVFIELVQTRGVRFRHGTGADFEAELALETRVSAYAAPRRERVRTAA